MKRSCLVLGAAGLVAVAGQDAFAQCTENYTRKFMNDGHIMHVEAWLGSGAVSTGATINARRNGGAEWRLVEADPCSGCAVTPAVEGDTFLAPINAESVSPGMTYNDYHGVEEGYPGSGGPASVGGANSSLELRVDSYSVRARSWATATTRSWGLLACEGDSTIYSGASACQYAIEDVKFSLDGSSQSFDLTCKIAPTITSNFNWFDYAVENFDYGADISWVGTGPDSALSHFIRVRVIAEYPGGERTLAVRSGSVSSSRGIASLRGIYTQDEEFDLTTNSYDVYHTDGSGFWLGYVINEQLTMPKEWGQPTETRAFYFTVPIEPNPALGGMPTAVRVERYFLVNNCRTLGDVDQDGNISIADRTAIVARIGEFIGPDAQGQYSELYEPLCDWDNDGTVEQADLDAFDATHCVVDLNGDSVIDAADMTVYDTWYTNGDMRADINGDGILTLADDYTDFYLLWQAGC